MEVGLARLKVTRVLIREPDRGGSMYDLGPRLLMHLADVPATEVVQPGSRLSYRLLLRGEESDLESLKEALPLAPNYRWRGIRDSSPSIGSALDRAESFLLLGGLLGVLLAGVAVALRAHRYARRHYDHVGILKTLGATPREILSSFRAAARCSRCVAAVSRTADRLRVASDHRGRAGLCCAHVVADAYRPALAARYRNGPHLRARLRAAAAAASEQHLADAGHPP